MAVQVSNPGPAGELQHDQINGDLERALEPPGWVRDRHTQLVVVNRVKDSGSLTRTRFGGGEW